MARKTKRKTISMHPDVYRAICEVAADDGMSASEWPQRVARAEIGRRGLALPDQRFIRPGGGVAEEKNSGVVHARRRARRAGVAHASS